MHIDKINADLVHTVLKYLTRYEIRFLYLFLLLLFWKWYKYRFNPELLSNQIRQELKQSKRELERKKRRDEILASRPVTIIIFCLPLFVSLLAVLLQFSFGKVINNNLELNNPLSKLFAMGAILASFTGFLIPVMVFAINTERLNLLRISSLAGLFLQALYFKPIVALAAGTITGILFNSVFFGNFAFLSTIIFVLFAVLVIILDLFFLFQSVVIFDRQFVNKLFMEYYKSLHNYSLLAHVKRRLYQNLYINNLKKIGFRWAIPIGKDKKTEYIIGKNNYYLTDVNFKPLKKLSKRLNISCQDKEELEIDDFAPIKDKLPEVYVLPGQKIEKSNRLFIIPNTEYKSEFNSLIKKAFRCTRNNLLKVKPVDWSELSQLLKSLIQQKDEIGIKDLLDTLEKVIQDYLNIRKKIGWPHSRQTLDDIILSQYRPPTLINLDLYGILKTTIDSDYDEGFDKLSSFLYRMANIAFEAENKDYFDEVLSFVNLIYTMGIKSDKLRGTAKGETRRLYKRINEIFKGYIYSKENEDINASLKHLSPFVIVYLKNILDLLREIPKYEDIETFTKLIEMMNTLFDRWLEDNIEYMTSSMKTDKEQEESIEIRDKKLLCNLLLAAWLYKKTNNKKYEPEKIKPYINKSMEYIPDFKDLIEVYLQANSSEPHESVFEYGWWELREREPGESQEGSALSNWIQPFWIIVALSRAISKPHINIERIRLLSHISEFDCQHLKDSIERSIKQGGYNWLVGEDKLEQGRDCLLEIFAELAKRQKKIDLQKVIEASINEEAVAQFKQNIIQAYDGECEFTKLLEKFQNPNTSDAVTESVFVAVCVKQLIEKDNLIEKNRDTGWGGILGREFGNRENLRCAWLVEKHLGEVGKVNSFAEIEQKIKHEAGILRSKGFKPNVIFIPKDHRYDDALTKIPSWQRKPPFEDKNLPRWVASIDNMEVFVWPHVNSGCIGIIDIASFLMLTHEGSESPLDIKIEKPKQENLQGQEFQESLKLLDGDFDKLAETQRIITIKNNLCLKFIKLNAGVKLVLNPETMGLVYKRGETTFHKLECEIAQKIPSDEREYLLTLGLARCKEGFASCSKCKPSI